MLSSGWSGGRMVEGYDTDTEDRLPKTCYRAIIFTTFGLICQK